jgi:hypothetical protein
VGADRPVLWKATSGILAVTAGLANGWRAGRQRFRRFDVTSILKRLSGCLTAANRNPI